MEKESLKIAFSRVKEDILFLNNELNSLKSEVYEIKSILKDIQTKLTPQNNENTSKTFPTYQQTDKSLFPTHTNIPTDNPTVPQEIGGLKSQNTQLSTGNRGVPTDRQTYQQTDQQTQNKGENIEKSLLKATEILDSLDYLKKEIRQKFKKLTPQEMAVFSSIYVYEEQDPNNTTYKIVANNLKLSESSIRDYVLKIIDKGIPIKKQKIDNKKIILSISPELKKIATLSTIIQLRGL